jgi:hypothetical protein
MKYDKIPTHKKQAVISTLDILNILNEIESIKIGMYTHMEA